MQTGPLKQNLSLFTQYAKLKENAYNLSEQKR
jgi:hypothetical protein